MKEGNILLHQLATDRSSDRWRPVVTQQLFRPEFSIYRERCTKVSHQPLVVTLKRQFVQQPSFKGQVTTKRRGNNGCPNDRTN